jgi:phosphoribosylanthranilate isomerase
MHGQLRVRVKICGITNVADAMDVVRCGADAIGLVFYEPSPRAVSIAQAVEIVKHIPAFVTIVGLFVNADKSYVQAVLSSVRLDLLQFHGDESVEYCESFNRSFIKAIRVKPETNLLQYANEFSASQGLLLDAFTEGVPGGTGHVFDWSLIPTHLSLPIILAGGLNADNVSEAIAKINPYAVDVSGGVERNKGFKDSAKMESFMQAVSLSKLGNKV